MAEIDTGQLKALIGAAVSDRMGQYVSDVEKRLEGNLSAIVEAAIAKCVSDGTLVTKARVREIVVTEVQPLSDGVDQRLSKAKETYEASARELEAQARAFEVSAARLQGARDTLDRSLRRQEELENRLRLVEAATANLAATQQDFRERIFGDASEGGTELSLMGHIQRNSEAAQRAYEQIIEGLGDVSESIGRIDTRLAKAETFIANRRRIERMAVNGAKMVIPSIKEHPRRFGVVSGLVIAYILSHNPNIYAIIQAIFGG